MVDWKCGLHGFLSNQLRRDDVEVTDSSAKREPQGMHSKCEKNQFFLV